MAREWDENGKLIETPSTSKREWDESGKLIGAEQPAKALSLTGAKLSAPSQPTGIFNKAESWLGDVGSDIREGTTRTLPGRVLSALGAKGTSYGNSPEVGNYMASPIQGPIRAAQGLSQMYQPDKYKQGMKNFYGGIWDAQQIPASFLGGPTVETVVPKIAHAPKQVASAIKKGFTPNAEIDLAKIYGGQLDPAALSEVKSFGGGAKSLENKALLPSGLNSESAATKAIEHHQNALDQWLNRATNAGATVPGDEIVRATKAAIPSTMWREDPKGAQAIVDQAANAYGGRHFPVEQFREFLREKNAGLSSFYGKSQAGQSAGVIAGTSPAIEKAQADAIRESLYKVLDPENAGAGPREIQKRTGSIIELRNAAESKHPSILAEKPSTTAEGLVNVIAGPGRAAAQAVKGNPLALGTAMHPFKGPSDALLSRAYKYASPAAEIPLPKGELSVVKPRRLFEFGPEGAPISVEETAGAQFAQPGSAKRYPFGVPAAEGAIDVAKTAGAQFIKPGTAKRYPFGVPQP